MDLFYLVKWMLAVLNDRVRRTVSIRILGLASQQLCWEEGKKEIQMKYLNPSLPLDSNSSVCTTNTFTNHLQLSWPPNSVSDFHRRRICRCVANLHGSECWVAQCSQKGPACESPKLGYPWKSYCQGVWHFSFPLCLQFIQSSPQWIWPQL